MVNRCLDLRTFISKMTTSAKVEWGLALISDYLKAVSKIMFLKEICLGYNLSFEALDL